jgi:hypothetical protein
VAVELPEMASRRSSPASARAVRRETREDAMLATLDCSAFGDLEKIGSLADSLSQIYKFLSISTDSIGR